MVHVVLSTPTAIVASTSTTTILRVKRPRSVDPVPTLQFSGTRKKRARSIQGLSDQLASSSISNSNSNEKDLNLTATTNSSSSSLIWKLVGTSNSATNKRSFKYVDATLNTIDESSKRQRLTLEQPLTNNNNSNKSAISPITAGKKKKRYTTMILDPISRLLTEYLKKVQDGSATLKTYLAFLERDDRVRHDPQQYVSFAIPNNDGSNVLHLAALWNGVEEARHVLLTYPMIIPTILDTPDGNGQRPYQIALLAGNNQVAEVLEAFGADTNDYVYDVFELQATPDDDDKQSTATTAGAVAAATTATTTMVVELHGGVGYLNEHGELILEALSPEDYEQDSDKERDDDDDVDSNAEDYEFNDYPDEEEEEEDANSDDQEYEATNFRHSDVYNASQGTTAVVAPPGGENYPNDDDAAAYDAQYGIYNDSDGGEDGEGGGTQRFYAYDPEFD